MVKFRLHLWCLFQIKTPLVLVFIGAFFFQPVVESSWVTDTNTIVCVMKRLGDDGSFLVNSGKKQKTAAKDDLDDWLSYFDEKVSALYKVTHQQLAALELYLHKCCESLDAPETEQSSPQPQGDRNELEISQEGYPENSETQEQQGEEDSDLSSGLEILDEVEFRKELREKGLKFKKQKKEKAKRPKRKKTKRQPERKKTTSILAKNVDGEDEELSEVF